MAQERKYIKITDPRQSKTVDEFFEYLEEDLINEKGNSSRVLAIKDGLTSGPEVYSAGFGKNSSHLFFTREIFKGVMMGRYGVDVELALSTIEVGHYREGYKRFVGSSMRTETGVRFIIECEPTVLETWFIRKSEGLTDG